MYNHHDFIYFLPLAIAFGVNGQDGPKVLQSRLLFGRGTINTADYQLSMDLLANYPAGYNVLPVTQPKDVLDVTFQMALYSIVGMSEQEQSLTTNCEIITKWHDVFLTWDPQHYDNITDTRLPWDKVWTPDIVLYNSAGDGEKGSREMKTLIQVTYDGEVTLLTQSIYMSKCRTDVTYYPFDAQECELKFASWTTEVTRINMTYAKVSTNQLLRSYQPSGVFQLKRIYVKRDEAPDPCCEEDVKFAAVTYFLVIWRRPKFFLFNYIQPAVLINVLALFMFVIPAESGEKITLGISTMLNMSVFLIDTGLPATDQIPIISVYYAFTMLFSTAATVMGVIVLTLHHQGRRGDPVPQSYITVAKYLAVLSCSSYSYNKSVGQNSKEEEALFLLETTPLLETTTFLEAANSTFSSRRGLVRGGDSRDSATSRTTLVSAPSRTTLVSSPSRTTLDSRDSSRTSSIPEGRATSVRKWQRVAGHRTAEFPKGTLRSSIKGKILNISSAAGQAGRQSRERQESWSSLSTTSQYQKEEEQREQREKIAENRWKMEERKAMINEEWKKVSRVADRFLLIIFSLLSLINTSWFLLTSFASPHFLDGENGIEEDEIVKNRTIYRTG